MYGRVKVNVCLRSYRAAFTRAGTRRPVRTGRHQPVCAGPRLRPVARSQSSWTSRFPVPMERWTAWFPGAGSEHCTVQALLTHSWSPHSLVAGSPRRAAYQRTSSPNGQPLRPFRRPRPRPRPRCGRRGSAARTARRRPAPVRAAPLRATATASPAQASDPRRPGRGHHGVPHPVGAVPPRSRPFPRRGTGGRNPSATRPGCSRCAHAGTRPPSPPVPAPAFRGRPPTQRTHRAAALVPVSVTSA